MSNSVSDSSSTLGLSHIYSIDHLKTTDSGLRGQMLSTVNPLSYIN